MITSRTLEFEDIDVLYGIAELKKVPFVRSQSGDELPEIMREPFILINEDCTDIVEVGTLDDYFNGVTDNQINKLVQKGYHGFVRGMSNHDYLKPEEQYALADSDTYFHDINEKVLETFDLADILEYVSMAAGESAVDADEKEKLLQSMVDTVNQQFETSFTTDDLYGAYRKNSDMNNEFYNSLSVDDRGKFDSLLNGWIKEYAHYGSLITIPYYYVRNIKSEYIFKNKEDAMEYAEILNLDKTAHIYELKLN